MREFRVAWSDWQAFSRELLGSYQRVGCFFQFTPPMSFPDMSDVVVTSLNVEPFDGGNPDGSDIRSIEAGTNSYPSAGAKVTATYESLHHAGSRSDLPTVPDGTYLTFQTDLGAEYLSVPGRVWRWATPPDFRKLPPDVNPGIVIPTESYRLTWHRVASPDWDILRSLRGKINSETFMGSEAGTVLFLGAKATREFSFVGDDGFWKIEFTFSERAIELAGGGLAGWNYFYKELPIGGEHWAEIEDITGNSPYASADLETLFAFSTC